MRRSASGRRDWPSITTAPASLSYDAVWGYGMAVAEALARGLPVVASPGIAELVGREGCWYRLGTPDALTAAPGACWRRRPSSAASEGARHVRNRLPTWADQSAGWRTCCGRPRYRRVQSDWLALRAPATPTRDPLTDASHRRRVASDFVHALIQPGPAPTCAISPTVCRFDRLAARRRRPAVAQEAGRPMPGRRPSR